MDVDALTRAVIDSRARRNPAWATSVGIRGRDHLLRDASARSYEEEAEEVGRLLDAARSLPASLARDALVAALALERFDLSEARTWARNPDLATECLDHVLAVLLAPHLAPAEKVDALRGRLAAAPRYFHDGWARYDARDVPKLWVEGALLSVDAAPAFVDAVRAFLDENAAADAMAPALDALSTTLAAHGAWLRALHPLAAGEPALGEARFRALLALRHVPEAPDELARMGESLAARFRDEMARAAADMGASSVEEAWARMRADHPASFEDALQETRASIEEARAFVLARGLATPTDVPLEVIETPSFLRHLVPFAAYQGPPRFASPRKGTYMVTRKEDLAAFPRADVRNTTVHEAWPGHHLQMSVAAERAPLAAWLVDAVDLAEGWALYCEAMMGEEGYTSAPAERLVRARDALWRALRISLDVGLHVGTISPAQARDRLVRETGMSQEEAEAEALRYTLAPAYNLSYMYGRLRIEAARERWLRGGGSLRGFHDAVLAAGPLPMALLDRALASPDIRQT